MGVFTHRHTFARRCPNAFFLFHVSHSISPRAARTRLGPPKTKSLKPLNNLKKINPKIPTLKFP